jgi:hypothetical protein
MRVGSFGENLWNYEESGTYLSTDGGLSWRMVHKGSHKYEFGDLGSILVIVDNEELTDVIRYSWIWDSVGTFFIRRFRTYLTTL